jgi:TPP-dependent 2-oxoacid decarboxylase
LYGIRHVVGVPGDYVLGFYFMIQSHSKLKVINMCHEQSAGFASDDAYAPIQGLAAACILLIVLEV